MENENKNNNNEDNHATTQILLFLCIIICLISLWFSANTFYLVKNYINIESGKVNRAEVTVLENE